MYALFLQKLSTSFFSFLFVGLVDWCGLILCGESGVGVVCVVDVVVWLPCGS